ncbi:MAG TPA: hypothetical protein VIM89_07910 [Mucilaginibacter sp.]
MKNGPTLILLFFSLVAIAQAQSNYNGYWKTKWKVLSGYDSIIVSISPNRDFYNISLKLGSNQAEWNWTATLRNNILETRTNTADGAAPIVSLVSKNKIKVSNFYLMGSNETELNKWVKSKSSFLNIYSFWSNFKNLAISKNYIKLSQLTYFPFLRQNKYLNQEEFKAFKFPDAIIKAIRTSTGPIKSSMSFNGGTDNKGNPVMLTFDPRTIYEVNVGGPTIYFAVADDSYKFIGILYGE